MKALQLHAGPRALAHPIREAGRRLKWIVAFAGGQEITEAKFKGVLVHERLIFPFLVDLAIPVAKCSLASQ